MRIKPKSGHASPFEGNPGPSGWKPTRKRSPQREGGNSSAPERATERAIDEQPTTGIAPRGAVTSRKI